VACRKDNYFKLDVENAFLGMETEIPPGIVINELVSSSSN